MHKPLISVVVPVYNTKQYLVDCVESIVNQSLREIEIILVDDGSTDGSGQLCDELALKDSRIKVCHQRNLGAIAARYMGVTKSSSKYITFVDSDDFIEKCSYELAIEAIRDNIDVICFDITRFFSQQDGHTDVLPFRAGRYNRKEIETHIYPSMIWTDNDTWGVDPSLCSKIVKKDLMIKSCEMVKCHNFHYGDDSSVIYPIIKWADTLEIIRYSYYNHRQWKGTGNAAYLTAPDFFDRLYDFYSYLRKHFQDEASITQQIEKLFIRSVNLRKRMYYKGCGKIKYIFPFDRVNKNERIVLYGAGIIGHSYRDQVLQLSYCEIVLWVDRNYEKYGDEDVVSPREIENTSFDKIVVAIKSPYAQETIKNDLMNMGVKNDKIILMKS